MINASTRQIHFDGQDFPGLIPLSNGSPLISAITDNFDDNVKDAQWNNTNPTQVIEQNQQLEMTSKTTSEYFGYQSVTDYYFKNGSAATRLVQQGSTTITSLGLFPVQLASGATSVKWIVAGGIAIPVYNTGSGDNFLTGRTHTDGDYYRIREAADRIYFEYSTDGTTYSAHDNIANPLSGDYVYITIQIGTYASEATTTTAIFDNFNVVTSSQTVTLPHISSGSTLYGMTLTPGAVSITLPLISNTNTLYALTLTPGAVSLTLPLISNTNTLYAMTLTVGAVTVTLPLLSNASTLYGMTLTPGAISITMPLISTTGVLYEPTLSAGASTLTLPLIASTTTLYGFSLGLNIETPFIAAGSTLYAPTLTVGAVTLTLPLISNTNTLYAMALAYGMSLPLIASIAQAFAPTVLPGAVTLDMPSITDTDSLYAPTLELADQLITMPFLNDRAISGRIYYDTNGNTFILLNQELRLIERV